MKETQPERCEQLVLADSLAQVEPAAAEESTPIETYESHYQELVQRFGEPIVKQNAALGFC